MPGMQTPRTHLANGHIQMNDHRRRVRLNLAFGQTARGWTSGPGALPQATMDIAVGEQNVMDIAVGEQNVIISPLANKRLANGHVQHSQGQRPWNMNFWPKAIFNCRSRSKICRNHYHNCTRI